MIPGVATRQPGVSQLPAMPRCPAAASKRGQLLATSLFEDPAAGLHEDASARLREHPALLGCLILRQFSPPSSVGGHQDLAGGHEENTVAITQSDRILGTLRCGSAAYRCRICVGARIRLATVDPAQIWKFGTRAGVGAVTAGLGELVTREERGRLRSRRQGPSKQTAADHSNQNPAGMMARRRKLAV